MKPVSTIFVTSLNNFNNLLHDTLSQKPNPLFVFNDTVIPAATIWVGVRAWCKYFRELGLTSGDRILLAYPESPAFVHIVLASIWEKLTLAIIRPDTLHNALVEEIDVRLIITSKDFVNSVSPDTMGMPSNISSELRSMQREKIPEIRFILKSSGTTGNSKFICLTETGILSVIQSHTQVFDSKHRVVLSILPWSHCFGLVLDLFLSLFNAESIIRDSESGKNLDSIFTLADKYKITHLSSVPFVIEKILQQPNGKIFIQSLESGIIGGAPISKPLAEHLKNSNLCVGYGQTEASPGICLGEKGKFFPNYIGKPLDCKIKISEQGELFFRGENAFYGYWRLDSTEKVSTNSWIPTGDLVEEKSEGLFFKGRLDFSFKLPNGVMIQPEEIEENLKLQIPALQNVFIFYSNQIYLYFSTNSLEPEERIINSIHNCLPSLLKHIFTSIQYLPQSEWIFSAKGGIERKKMLETLQQA